MADPEDVAASRSSGDPLPASVMMPLLTLITHQALDQDYVRSAERRAASGATPPPRRRYAAAAAILVFGLLVSTAAVQRSRNAEVNDAGRTTLTGRITEQRERVSRLQSRIASLRAANAESVESLAQTVDSAEEATNQVRRLRTRTGFAPVTGPGVQVTVTERGERGPQPGRLRLGPRPARQRSLERRGRGHRDQRTAAHRLDRDPQLRQADRGQQHRGRCALRRLGHR